MDRSLRLIRWSLVLAVLVSLGAVVGAAVRQAEEAPTALQFRVPMRDGIKLATSVYLPTGEGPWPVLVTRTPYDKARYGRRATRYTGAGYALVVQDCRGRFASEGVYEPYQTDLEDGYDTVEWAAGQSFSNGRVGVTGRSAMAITANLAAAADPPHLVAAYVVTAPESLFDESYFMGGVFREHFRGNFMRLQGVADQIPVLKARAVLDRQWLESDLIHHRHKIRVPMYNVGGWYDMFAKGAVNNFSWLHNHGREGARGNQKLWMGPWAHSRLDGDLDYPGARGLRRAFDDELRWFEYWLKGVDNGMGDEPAVTYYHMAAARRGAVSGKNGLRRAANWPPPSEETRFYLIAGGGLTRQAHPAGARRRESTTSYRFDPGDPVPTVGGANYNNFPQEAPISVGPVDQRQIPDRADYLRFETAPLEEDLTVQGQVVMDLFAATDGPGTDFTVKLVDVYPDGYEALVLDSVVRTRYRLGRRPEDVKMMTPGKPERLRVDLWHTSLTFESGHRVAVHVSSSNFPRFEVNPNTGEAAGKSTRKPRVATNTIYHDAAHPSALVLPVTRLEERRAAGPPKD